MRERGRNQDSVLPQLGDPSHNKHNQLALFNFLASFWIMESFQKRLHNQMAEEVTDGALNHQTENRINQNFILLQRLMNHHTGEEIPQKAGDSYQKVTLQKEGFKQEGKQRLQFFKRKE